MVLAAFAGAQLRVFDQYAYRYLILKLIGSAILAVLAYLERPIRSANGASCFSKAFGRSSILWSLLARVRGRDQAAIR